MIAILESLYIKTFFKKFLTYAILFDIIQLTTNHKGR